MLDVFWRSSLIYVSASLKCHGLTVKPSKTEIAFDETFLGHKPGGGFLEPDQADLSKILNIQKDKTKPQIR